MTADLGRLSSICLDLPEATAVDHQPHRGFMVAAKNFAWYTVNEHGDGRVGLQVRLAPGVNEELTRADPGQFGLPRYVARHGWVTYYLDVPGRQIDWGLVERLVAESYRLQAPKRLRTLPQPIR